MHEDDNQLILPASFTALFADARGRLRAPLAQVRERYELCEDLAQQLVDQAQMLYHTQAPSETQVLHLLHTGLCAAESGLHADEATWVVTRLAELLNWPCPLLQSPTAQGEPPEA